MSETVPAVYACIAAVSAEMAQSGISKDRRNEQQGYRFRGIDDVYNALAPVLVKHKLVILPRILSRSVVERTTAKGGVLFYVTVEAEFDFVSVDDGSKVTARTYGEAMDSADKATNKAMSAAYKYAAFQTFCIPTEGDNDADASHHEVAPRQTPRQQPQNRPQAQTAQSGGLKVKATKVGKTGEKNGKPWTLYIVTLSDGRDAKTFDAKVYEAAQAAQRAGTVVEVDLDEKNTITNFLPVRQLRESA